MLRGTCSLNRMDSESIESVHRRFGTFGKGEGMHCGGMLVVIGSSIFR